MKRHTLPVRRVRNLLSKARRSRILVIGDVMLDQFIWGHVGRISPEAPVPVVEFRDESFMPGGAANVAHNLAALGVRSSFIGVVGRDEAATTLRRLLKEQGVDCHSLLPLNDRPNTFTPTIPTFHLSPVSHPAMVWPWIMPGLTRTTSAP